MMAGACDQLAITSSVENRFRWQPSLTHDNTSTTAAVDPGTTVKVSAVAPGCEPRPLDGLRWPAVTSIAIAPTSTTTGDRQRDPT